MRIGDLALLLGYGLLMGLPTAYAWSSFLSVHRPQLGRVRRVLSSLGLGGITIAAIMFLGMAVHLVMTGGIERHWDIYRAWALPGSVLSLVSPWFVLAARGPSRVVGFIAGVVVAFMWYLSTMAV